MNQASSVQNLFLRRLREAKVTHAHGWVLIEDLAREAFGLPTVGLPIAGPTAKGSLSLTQRTTVRRAINALSKQGLVELSEQLPTERRRIGAPGVRFLAGRRSMWARLVQTQVPLPRDRRDAEVPGRTSTG